MKAPKYIRSEAMARAVDKLQELHEYGCKSIVDPCPMDLGRDIVFAAEVVRRTGINIVCATGVYNEAEGIPYTFRSMKREEIVELYIKEITEGVGEAGIRAGVIKIATGRNPASKYERKMIGVAGEVSRLAGVPIISRATASNRSTLSRGWRARQLYGGRA